MGSSFHLATYYFLGLDRGVYPWYKEVHVCHVIKCVSRGRWRYHFTCAQAENIEHSHIGVSAPGAQLFSSLTCLETS